MKIHTVVIFNRYLLLATGWNVEVTVLDDKMNESHGPDV